MSSAHQNLSSIKMVNIPNVDHFSFTIITAQWNKEVTGALEKGCLETLLVNGVKKENIQQLEVPGAWELISAAKMVLDSKSTNAVICIGAVIKGDTPHFEYICEGVTVGLAQLCANQSIPVIYGVLTVNNLQQALDRCGGIHGNKGDEAAVTALQMASLGQKISF
jgi:6,7-dimethyl-8-ribityllumazine synthase